MPRSQRTLAVALMLVLAVAACAGATTTPSPSVPASAATSAPNAATTLPASATPDACARANLKTLTAGRLTIGTDNPAFGPWFAGPAPAKTSTWQYADPNNGAGLEAATAYAIADKLGFARADVVWVVVPFNNVIQPGPKSFDLDLNEVSWSAKRAEQVDLSDGYFDDNQAVVGLKANGIAKVTTVSGLASLRLGTQVGTTSYAYIADNIRPSTKPSVYSSMDAAIAALKAKQIDGVVADLGTAFFMRDAQLSDGVIVGRLPTVGEQERFAAVLNLGSPLTPCVNQAIAALKADGALEQIRQKWIVSTEGDVPELK